MSKKAPPQKPPAAAPTQPDLETAGFNELLERFNNSSCDNESHAIATHIFKRFTAEAIALLPIVEPHRLNFNGDEGVSTHEWASALLAAKQLRAVNEQRFDAVDIEEVIGRAEEIYGKTRTPALPNLTKEKEEAMCRPL